MDAALWQEIAVMGLCRTEYMDHAGEQGMRACPHVDGLGGQPQSVYTNPGRADHFAPMHCSSQRVHSGAALTGQLTAMAAEPRRYSIRMSAAGVVIGWPSSKLRRESTWDGWTLTLHLAADRFNLLLLDIVPPDGSGMELLAELRARPGAFDHDADARQAAATDLRQGMGRVSHLLAQLLTMARLEVGALQGNTEKVGVAELARQRLAAMAQLARTRSINLVYDAPEVLISQIDRSDVLSILNNVVDNAIRYTPWAAGSKCGCSGLGLAIEERMVASQTGSLRFAAGLAGRGVGFVVRLPV